MYQGSMVGAGSHVFAVWGYCIACADPEDHTVELNPALLSTIIGDTVDRIQDAVAYLCSPDPHSHCPEHDGARLVHQSGFAYFLVTHEQYRDIQSNEELRAYFRETKRRQRMSKTVQDNIGQSQDPASAFVSVSASSQEGGPGETWRTSFAIYQAEEQAAYDALRQDTGWLAGRQKYHPNLDILLTLEKAHVDFWGTEGGWAWKKKNRSAKSINWKSTFTTSLSLKGNQVWKDRAAQAAERPKSIYDYERIRDACQRGMERIRGTSNWQDKPELVKEYQELRANKLAADKAIAGVK